MSASIHPFLESTIAAHKSKCDRSREDAKKLLREALIRLESIAHAETAMKYAECFVTESTKLFKDVSQSSRKVNDLKGRL